MLLEIILFPLSMRFSLICRLWAFSIIHNRPLGLADWAFILDWRQRPGCFNGRASSLGLASGPANPFFKPYQFQIVFCYEKHKIKIVFKKYKNNFFVFSKIILNNNLKKQEPNMSKVNCFFL